MVGLRAVFALSRASTSSPVSRLRGTPLLLLSCRPLALSAASHAGHSKWQNIRVVKGKNDSLRGAAINIFVKSLRASIKEGGSGDPKKNTKLAELLAPVPFAKDLMQKWIDKILAAQHTQQDRVVLSGPGGSFFVIDALVDKDNRLRSLIKRRILKLPKGGGFAFLADGKSTVRRVFEEKGVVEAAASGEASVTLDDAESLAIELGAEEVRALPTPDDGDAATPVFEFLCEAGAPMERLRRDLCDRQLNVVSAENELRPAPYTAVTLNDDDEQMVAKFYEILEEFDDDITRVSDNIAANAS